LHVTCVVILQRTAVHCNALQHTATHCNTLQHTAAHCNTLRHTILEKLHVGSGVTLQDTLQDTATHCNTLQHTATHNTRELARWMYSHTEHTATHCNTLQHTASVCTILYHNATHCNTLKHTTTYCNTRVKVRILRTRYDEVSSFSRLLKIIGLFCRISSLLHGSFAKRDI